MIRDAVVGDVEAMLAIYRPIVQTTAISFELELPSIDDFAARVTQVQASDPWLVLEREGEVAGYAYATAFRSRAAYATTRETTVYVNPEHQRVGVAHQLMVELMTRLRGQGVHRAIAGIVLPNESSVSLHRRLGFRHLGTFDEIGSKFGRWHDLSFWAAPLPSHQQLVSEPMTALPLLVVKGDE